MLFSLFSGNISVPQRYGYGNCERLVGKSFTNVMERLQGDYILTTMDLHVVPPTGYKEDEVFKVSLKHDAQPKDSVWLTSYIRQSTYSKFQSCADKPVDIKLCACAKEQTAGSSVPREMFSSKTIVKDLHSGCLLLLRRNYGKSSLALEVTNVCTNRTYKLELSGSVYDKLFSNALPIRRELPPKTFHFLTSVYEYILNSDYPLNLRASIQVKKENSVKFINLGAIDVL